MNISNLIETDKLNIINSNLINEIKYYPQIKKNIVYIVAVVLINEKNQICLVQEAKLNCYKKWYLPAGKVEPNESLNQACIREAKEETGYVVQPLKLFNIELGSTGNWFRFSFVAQIIGGALKVQPDKESLRADWFGLSNLSEIDLRSNDFIKLAELGVNLYQKYEFNSLCLNDSKCMSLKDKFIISKDVSKDLIVYGFVLLNETNNNCLLKYSDKSLLLPSCIITSYYEFAYNLNYVIENVLFKDCFKSNSNVIDYKCVGCSSVCFNANNNTSQHGIQIVFVLNVLNEKLIELNQFYSWIELDNQFDIDNLINLMIN